LAGLLISVCAPRGLHWYPVGPAENGQPGISGPAAGTIAGGQRRYYGNSNPNCARAGTIAVTVLAGPLNYAGVNPKVACKEPQPSG